MDNLPQVKVSRTLQDKPICTFKGHNALLLLRGHTTMVVSQLLHLLGQACFQKPLLSHRVAADMPGAVIVPAAIAIGPNERRAHFRCHLKREAAPHTGEAGRSPRGTHTPGSLGCGVVKGAKGPGLSHFSTSHFEKLFRSSRAGPTASEHPALRLCSFSPHQALGKTLPCQ